MMDQTNTRKQSSPLWPGSISTSMGRWMTMAFMKGSCWMDREAWSPPTSWTLSRTRRRPRARTGTRTRATRTTPRGPAGHRGGQQQDGRADGAPGPGGGACANVDGRCLGRGRGGGGGGGWGGGGGADAVPHPRKITLIKQLAKSVIVAWDPPLVPPGRGPVTGYNVLVDKEVRASVPAGSRTKALIEKLNLAACTYRVSVQSVAERGVSDELRCSLLVGRNVVVAPYCLRVDDITQDSALVSWLPSNSNYSHTVLLNGAEHREVRPTCYRCRLADLRPMTVYKVTAVAKPHQMPWQLPLEQREKKEMSLEFCTQAAAAAASAREIKRRPGAGCARARRTAVIIGTRSQPNKAKAPPPDRARRGASERPPPAPGSSARSSGARGPLPPQDVEVQCGHARGSCRCAGPPPLSETGTSNGASVIGYAVCTKGQRVAEVLLPLADFVTVELTRIQCLEAREVVVRTLSVQGESQDSPVAPIPTTPSLEAPRPGRRSPSPEDPAPATGAPIPDTLAKAIARQAAQRVAAESGRERSGFREGNGAGHALHSDEEEEEEEGYDSAHVRRRGASVDEFLRGPSWAGRGLTVRARLRQIQYSQSEEYHTESSRGSDLSDIMEEDEEELYSEMQLEEGRRRSMGPHGALKVLGNAHGTGRQVRHGRDSGRGPPQRRPITVPSIDSGREHPSNRYFDESEPEDLCRVFVALFDYDPLSMSPNPDAADEELPFKEGQIIRVYGDKDTDGFYRGEIGSRAGLIPCNMVSEIQAEDEETLDQLLKQGFLSLNTPVDKIDRSRRGTRQPPTATRRMVALYDYDPRESSPNVDVEAELTFCAGDIIAVFGEIDEDGFYYGEINGHRGLIPSNFLEEVPADVEVYLTDTPRQTQDTPSGSETKRQSTEILGTPRRSTSPTACPPQPEAGPGAPGPELAQGPKVSLEPSLPLGTCSPLRAPDSPIRASRDLSSKKKKGLLSKGKNLLKKLAVVK
ncbi:hypothetical protein ANANG_G00269650 [Anguilla anguilla]|uniref:RIMS binding protein 2 n=1 Tax=Anguilla anguilla TaxID=7936 RepID=A0A9D3LUT9_ANGAN|nr:hypothetical protein ANANG_G00269650 [Anguilla anguilla]